MAKVMYDEDGCLEEPCLSCDKVYIEDIWFEWCCDERERPYKIESENYNCMACAHDGDSNICNECENGSKYLKWRTV